MRRELLALLCCVILIIIIYGIFILPDRVRRNRAKKLLEKSAGTFDNAAQTALNELENLTTPRAEDYFTRAEIIRLNRAENLPTQLETEYIAQNYIEAMAHFDNPEPFVIDRIEEFQHRLDIDPRFDYLAQGFDDVANATLPQARAMSIESRKQTAAAAPNHLAAAETYFDNSIAWTNDHQNVHDGKVNKDLRRALDRLPPVADVQTAFAEIQNYLQENSTDETKTANALKTLKRMSKNTTLHTLGDGEANILARVWQRTHAPENAEVQNLLREAIGNSLADSVQGNGTVCINGRCGRVINSLAAIDRDPVLTHGAMTTEAYKNQIFHQSSVILENAIAAAANDPTLPNLAESYTNPTVKVDPDVEERFKSMVKQKMDENLEQYTAQFSADELAQLKVECHAGVDV